MPELPEVETVRRELEADVVGLAFKEVHVLYKPLIATSDEEFVSVLPGQKILSLGRKGKYLIIHLSSDYALLVHFRMEGKLYKVKGEKDSLNKYVTAYFVMSDGSYLIFQDVRKFGKLALYKEEDLMKSPELSKLGKEPWDIHDPQYLLDKFKDKNTLLKEALLDQTIILGLGNIYTDEVMFRSKISPFREAGTITYEEAESLISNASEVMQQAIKAHGSTIRTYHPKPGEEGSMQNYLQVYGRGGKPCLVCGHTLEKKKVGGRSTVYCPSCQHVCPSLAITGKIAVGKSQVSKVFNELGCYTASCDQMVHDLYLDRNFLKGLEKKFPEVFVNGELDKSAVIKNMNETRGFRRKYETYLWHTVREMTDDFLIHHTDKVAVVEVPLLFDAKMEDLFTYTLGVESDKQVDYLLERHDYDVERRLELNKKNSYDRYRSTLSFIIVNNGSREEMEEKVREVYGKIARA